MYVIILVTQIINANEKTPKKHKKCFGAKYFHQIKNGHFKMSIFYFPIYFCVKKK